MLGHNEIPKKDYRNNPILVEAFRKYPEIVKLLQILSIEQREFIFELVAEHALDPTIGNINKELKRFENAKNSLITSLRSRKITEALHISLTDGRGIDFAGFEDCREEIVQAFFDQLWKGNTVDALRIRNGFKGRIDFIKEKGYADITRQGLLALLQREEFDSAETFYNEFGYDRSGNRLDFTPEIKSAELEFLANCRIDAIDRLILVFRDLAYFDFRTCEFVEAAKEGYQRAIDKNNYDVAKKYADSFRNYGIDFEDKQPETEKEIAVNKETESLFLSKIRSGIPDDALRIWNGMGVNMDFRKMDEFYPALKEGFLYNIQTGLYSVARRLYNYFGDATGLEKDPDVENAIKQAYIKEKNNKNHRNLEILNYEFGEFINNYDSFNVSDTKHRIPAKSDYEIPDGAGFAPEYTSLTLSEPLSGRPEFNDADITDRFEVEEIDHELKVAEAKRKLVDSLHAGHLVDVFRIYDEFADEQGFTVFEGFSKAVKQCLRKCLEVNNVDGAVMLADELGGNIDLSGDIRDMCMANLLGDMADNLEQCTDKAISGIDLGVDYRKCKGGAESAVYIHKRLGNKIDFSGEAALLKVIFSLHFSLGHIEKAILIHNTFCQPSDFIDVIQENYIGLRKAGVEHDAERLRQAFNNVIDFDGLVNDEIVSEELEFIPGSDLPESQAAPVVPHDTIVDGLLHGQVGGSILSGRIATPIDTLKIEPKVMVTDEATAEERRRNDVVKRFTEKIRMGKIDEAIIMYDLERFRLNFHDVPICRAAMEEALLICVCECNPRLAIDVLHMIGISFTCESIPGFYEKLKRGCEKGVAQGRMDDAIMMESLFFGESGSGNDLVSSQVVTVSQAVAATESAQPPSAPDNAIQTDNPECTPPNPESVKECIFDQINKGNYPKASAIYREFGEGIGLEQMEDYVNAVKKCFLDFLFAGNIKSAYGVTQTFGRNIDFFEEIREFYLNHISEKSARIAHKFERYFFDNINPVKSVLPAEKDSEFKPRPAVSHMPEIPQPSFGPEIKTAPTELTDEKLINCDEIIENFFSYLNVEEYQSAVDIYRQYAGKVDFRQTSRYEKVLRRCFAICLTDGDLKTAHLIRTVMGSGIDFSKETETCLTAYIENSDRKHCHQFYSYFPEETKQVFITFLSNGLIYFTDLFRKIFKGEIDIPRDIQGYTEAAENGFLFSLEQGHIDDAVDLCKKGDEAKIRSLPAFPDSVMKGYCKLLADDDFKGADKLRRKFGDSIDFSKAIKQAYRECVNNGLIDLSIKIRDRFEDEVDFFN